MSRKNCVERGVMCSALLAIFLISVAGSVVINQGAQSSNQPIIKYFGLQDSDIAYIGSTINLTCKMENTDVGIFLKAGDPVREGGRFTYMFEPFGKKGTVGSLEIKDVMETDEGIFTCYAYKAGLSATKNYNLKPVSSFKDFLTDGNNGTRVQ